MAGTIAQALGNIRNARLLSPNNIWNSVAVRRRAAVLALLYTDHYGQLSCLVTLRDQRLSYGGDAALPGGKADFENEMPYEVARREAWEEVQLPLDSGLPAGDQINYLATMPAYLSATFLTVVPVVAYLSARPGTVSYKTNLPDIFDSHAPSDEVHSIFTVPLSLFLNPKRYKTQVVDWGGIKFQQHFIQTLAREKSIGEPGQLTVWGLTANILIDLARIAYGVEPSMKHRRLEHYGDQALLEGLIEKGFFASDERPRFINFAEVFGPNSPLLRSRAHVD